MLPASSISVASPVSDDLCLRAVMVDIHISWLCIRMIRFNASLDKGITCPAWWTFSLYNYTILMRTRHSILIAYNCISSIFAAWVLLLRKGHIYALTVP